MFEILDFTIDTTDSTVDTTIAESQIPSISEQYGLDESNASTVFLTAAPTLQPSVTPTTSKPTGAPSMAGLVVSVDVSRTTTEPISVEEVEDLRALVADAYGVSLNDIDTQTEYVTSGVVSVDIPPGVSEDEMILDLQNALATALQIPSEDIKINVSFHMMLMKFCL